MTNEKQQALRLVVLTTIPQTIAAFFERQLQDLAAQGLEIHVISSPGSDLDQLAPGVPLHRHGIAMERQPHPVRDAKSLFQLCARIRQIRPHIVHAHTPKAGLLGMLAAKLAGVPVRLYTIHGLPLETRTGRLRQILEWAERCSSFCATRTYTVSRSLQTRVLELGLCSPDKIALLGDGSCSGVDIARFQDPGLHQQANRLRQIHKIPADAPLATFIGRLSRDKGVEVLAQAWSEISLRVPELHLLVAGELDHTDPISTAALQTLQSDPRIHLAGSIPYSEIPALYAASDFTVLPSFREGLCQVALESASAAIPIVATRVCGLVDSVADGLTGILVPARDPKALAQAIALMANDPALRAKLGAAAMDYVTARFSEQRVNQLWVGEYQRLVRESFPHFTSSAVGAET